MLFFLQSKKFIVGAVHLNTKAPIGKSHHTVGFRKVNLLVGFKSNVPTALQIGSDCSNNTDYNPECRPSFG
jgi:hypothetical protein